MRRVPLERYVRGVVSAEMPSSWPLAALEAQAIASRTYALTAHAGGSRFDVYSDTRSQVYLGVAAETAATNAAVAATAGKIVALRRAGRRRPTSSRAPGAMTESIQNAFLGSQPEPWLRGVADPYDGGPAFSLEGHHQLRVRGGAPAGPRQGRIPRHRGAAAGSLPADRLRRGARIGRGDARERPRTGGTARPRQHVGVLQRAERPQPVARSPTEAAEARRPAHARPSDAGEPAGSAGPQGGAQAPVTSVSAQASTTGGVAAG